MGIYKVRLPQAQGDIMDSGKTYLLHKKHPTITSNELLFPSNPKGEWQI